MSARTNDEASDARKRRRLTIAPMFVLEAPHYHKVSLGGMATFHGFALAPGEIPIAEVVAYRDGSPIKSSPVDIDSPELAWIRAPRSPRCGFSLDLVVERGVPIELYARYADGREVPVFTYDVPLVERDAAKLSALSNCITAMPVPSSDMITTTQGLGNRDAYRASTATSFVTMCSLLGAAAVAPSGIRSILDIGCGTGRLLVGWHCDDRRRTLVGTDVNRDLIGWSRANLPDVARWQVNDVRAPLDFAAESFDLIVLASVFTHLSLAGQKSWLKETHRLLAPRGHALITLHGDIYAELLLDDVSRAQYDEEGYFESASGAEGANSYSTFHSEQFARALFSGFTSIAFSPRGIVGRVARNFPLASSQDVYVLAK